MDINLKNIRINSFNCRGVRNYNKRQNIFTWLRQNFFGITFLQETHSTLTDIQNWTREWGGQIFFAHGEFNARGVAILVPKELEDVFKTVDIIADEHGRFLIINCEIEGNKIVLINLYCPTKDHLNAQKQFLETIKQHIENFSDKNIILAGDLNTYLNPTIDKQGGKSETQSSYSEQINNLCEEYMLVDIWRIRNPGQKTYTRRQMSKSGLVQSRLDYFLTSIGISYMIKKTEIKPGNSSDHSIITITLDLLDTLKRGKGYWKFNNDLLNDKDYVELIKDTIQDIQENTNMENKNTLWEFTKCQIRSKTILYAGQKAKKNKKIELKMLDRITELENNLEDKNNNYEEYLQLKAEWEHMLAKKNNGIMIRSKAKWVEEGERNSKYFLNLEKRNYNSTCIKKLVDANDKEITDLSEIIEEQKSFYETLYTSKYKNSIPTEINNDFFLKSQDIPKLKEHDKLLCEETLTLPECTSALKQLANNKSPGIDGFSTNFYKFFWIDIKILLYESYVYSFQNNLLTNEQRIGILNLLPKKDKDLRKLQNWRPVSLLTTDYKILTKALAIRLQKVIPNIIESDQVGYIKNRYIGENVRIIYDILMYSEENDIEAFLAQIDFEKAFDSIEWPFLFKCLKAFNFGENFIRWIKIIYNDISSCVGNNGYYSKIFKLSRSIRQGCPISALLFLLVAEIIAIHIRADKKIMGITINDTEFKISLMADDTTLILKNIESLQIALDKFKKFQISSGLKLNISKTEVIPIGRNKNKDIKLPTDIKEIAVKKGPFKALGVWFATDNDKIIELNFADRIKNMDKILNIWQSRNLSLKGKVLILKTLVVPQIQFLLGLVYVPLKTLKEIDSILFKFLWGNKPAKIKRSTIIAPVSEGGLGMIDIYSTHSAAKCGWIRRIYSNKESKWKICMRYMLNINKDTLNKNYNDEIVKKGKTMFHQQILELWAKLHGTDPKTKTEILNEYVLLNKHIKIERKPLEGKYFGNNCNENMKLTDILNSNGTTKSKELIETTNDSKLSILKYNALKRAIPKEWKTILKTQETIPINENNINRTCTPLIRISNIWKTIESVTSKNIYIKTILGNIQPPTVVDTWINIYPFLEVVEWPNIFTLASKITGEPYLQSLQYKVINRILNCNDKLYKWKIVQTPLCNSCKVNDTIEHHLFSCRDSKKLWDGIENWLRDNLSIGYKLTECEILFGIPISNTVDLDIMNFLILMGKQYINKQKTGKKEIYFFEFLNQIRSKLEIIITSNLILDRENSEWQNNLYNIL